MGDFSVKAVLSAVDRNFSSTMKSAMGYTNNLKSTLTSGLGFGIMMGAGQKAFSTLSSGVTGIISDMGNASAAWKTFEGNMAMNGATTSEIKSIKKELQDFATQTVYNASDMASTYSQLAAVGTKNTNKLVKGFGGLAAAAENPKQAMRTLSQQATQMAAKPAVAWEDFKLMLEQTPAGVAAVAKTMGMSTAEMIKNIQSGTIATEDFFNAVAETGTNANFTKLATEYKTVGQAMDGLTETVGTKLQPAFDTLSGYGIKAVGKITDAFDNIDGNAIAKKITAGVDILSKYMDSFKTNMSGVWSAFKEAFSAIGSEFSKMTGKLGSDTSVKNFGDMVHVAAGYLKSFAGFLKDNADKIALVLKNLPKLLIAYKGFKIVKAIAPGLSLFTKGIAGLAGKGIGGIASKLFGVSKGQKAVGSAGTVASGGLTSLKTGLNSLQKSAGIALIIGALAGLALAIKPLAALGATAVPPLLAFGVVVGGLAVILGTMGSKLQTSAVGIGVFAGAVSIMALAMAPIAQTGLEGAAAMGAFGLVVAGLVVVFALFGTALNAAVPGMLAFGATILMVGAGMALASVLINALTPFVKQLGDTVSQVAASISGAVTSIIGAFSGLVATIANAVSQIVTAIGSTLVNVMQTAGDVITGIVDSISDGFLKISDGVSNVVDSIGGAFTGILEAVADVINSIGTSAKNAGAGFKSVAQGIKIISDLSLIDIAKSLGAVALGMGQMSAQGKGLETAAKGMNGIVAGISAAAAGIALFSASLVQMNALGTSAAAGMETIKASLTGFTIPPIDISPILTAFAGITAGALALSTQMKAAGGQAGVSFSSAMISGCSGAMGAVQNAISAITAQIGILPGMMRGVGTQAGNGFRTALQSGLSPIPKIAADTMNKFNSELRTGGNKSESIMRSTVESIVEVAKSASDRMRSCGYYIGEGLASGMRASLGEVEAVASQLASAAEKAVRAKAKIKSPSKVFRRLGEYIGEGLTLGIESMKSAVEHAGENLVTIPEIPDLSPLPNGYFGGARELNNDYDYSQTIYVNAEVKSIMDGREVGYGSAKYVEEKNNFDSARRDRLGGKTNV